MPRRRPACEKFKVACALEPGGPIADISHAVLGYRGEMYSMRRMGKYDATGQIMAWAEG